MKTEHFSLNIHHCKGSSFTPNCRVQTPSFKESLTPTDFVPSVQYTQGDDPYGYTGVKNKQTNKPPIQVCNVRICVRNLLPTPETALCEQQPLKQADVL